MGWGSEPHEAWADGMSDASCSGGSYRGDDPDPVALRATCSCGWTAQIRRLPEDEGRWTEISEAIEELCRPERSSEHWLALVSPDPSTPLIVARGTSGKRGDTPPSAYMDRTLTDEARAAGAGPPQADFAQPAHAILRWSQR